MRVELDQWFCCLSECCPFRKECAQHTTAGDYRSEDGFTPDLYRKGNEYICNTADEEPFDNEGPSWGNEAPVNYNTLGRGFLSRKEIETKSVINYEI